MTTIRDDLAELLGKVASPGAFSARRTAPADDLRLEVKGLGRLELPVPEEQAERLCALARPARYGQGEETLLDRRVRDTWEVPKSRVKIDRRRWNRTLRPVLDALCADLGLPEDRRLDAELHSMLVYAPGQFFLPHQDTEKADDMVGTLVVTLPGAFRGGTLVVEHRGETASYRGSRKSLSCVAFYADCHHEVRPVKEGYRVVLTYNLMLRGEDGPVAAVEAPPGTVDPLAELLREYFATPLPPRWAWQKDDPPRDPPSRLVYLLDHQYTERGFGWSRLKGDDAARAATLRAAAERAGCEAVLALAEIQETWTAMEPGWDEPWYGNRRRWTRDDEDDEWLEDDPSIDDPDSYDLVDFIEGAITLDRWIDDSGHSAGAGAVPIHTHVDEGEVVSTTPTSDLEPYESEYEGYQGNWGNTMDRWYRRAAIVLWPREHAFAVRAEASPAWALEALEERIRAGAVAEARERAEALLPFWEGAAAREEHPGFPAAALRVAHGLDRPELATALLQPFRVESLTPERAEPFVALVARYGEDWTRALLAGDSDGRRPHTWTGVRDRSEWLPTLPRLCETLCLADCPADPAAGAAAARLVLENTWTWLREQIEDRRRAERRSLRARWLLELSSPLLTVLESAALVGADDLTDEAVPFLCAPENEPLVPCLVQMLRSAAETVPPALHGPAGFEAVAAHCARVLEEQLETPPRDPDDWSIELPDRCPCALCDTLRAFLADPEETRLEWPIAKEKRKHVHRRLDEHELPVRHETRRSGSPYTLILTKLPALFEREAAARRAREADLAWLTARA